MKISLVTISFNQAPYLERALRSVLDQGCPDLDYIVEDPGSTDGSRDIIEHYRGRLSRVIFEPDAGPADGLNKGFAQASGEVFGFLNSDDVLLPGALAAVDGFFSAHPDVDVVSGHCLVLDPEGRVLRRMYSDAFSLSRAAYGFAILCQPSTFFRAGAFRRTKGFTVTNRVIWDAELYVDMALAGARFAVMEAFLSGYRVHPGSITTSGNRRAEVQAYLPHLFRKVRGREMEPVDILAGAAMRCLRWITNPRNVRERLFRGPVALPAQVPARTARGRGGS